ncbi:MAG: flagellar motor protein MotB [Proteobacteria bacterium]|nr:flagellar motor protein MotB [Pseudomonadota bacterium]
MRKKKHDDGHENAERWLLTYADLITLLLAFFIMMYTFSKQDGQKYQEVSAHLKTIFTGGAGIVQKGSVSGTAPLDLMSAKSVSSNEIKKQIEQEIKTMAQANGLKDNFSVFSDERGIVIRIMDKAFFDEGKAELKDSAKRMLDKIIPVIKQINNHIRIEGHTDNVPINTNEFKSNWELSVRRATEVVRHLIERGGVSPQRISATGYAEYRPVVNNDSTMNRALNRRIEIIVAKSQAEQPENKLLSQ